MDGAGQIKTRLESMPDTNPRGDHSGLQIYPVFGFYPVDGSSCDGMNLSIFSVSCPVSKFGGKVGAI